MKRTLISLVLALLPGLMTSEATARKWTSRSGSFTVEAELVDVVDGNAVLKKEDGKELRVPLEKLSLRDVRYIQEVLKSATESVTGKEEKAQPAEPGKAPEPGASAPSAAPQPAADAGASTEGGPPLAKENSTEWQVKPDPPKEPFTLPPDAKLRIPLPERAYRMKVLYPGQLSPFVMLASDDSDAVKELWDLRTGRRAGRITEKIDLNDKPALSPDGLRLATATSYPEQCIQIWSFKTGKVDRKIPLDSSIHVESLGFAGPKRLFAAMSVRNGVRIWDPSTGKVSAEYRAKLFHDKQGFAVSPGGNYLAIAPMMKPPRIIDVRNGVEAGQLQVEWGKGSHASSAAALVFSPDGKELAGLFQVASGSALIVWDMATGQVAVDHRFPKSPSFLTNTSSFYGGCALEWFPDRSGWLLYGSAVIDRKRGGPVWVDPSRNDGNERIPRRILDADRILSAEGDADAMSLRLVSLPKAEIAASAEVVEAGGKAADAGLPPLTKIDRSSEKKVSFSSMGDWAYQPQTVPAGDLVQAPFFLELGSAFVLRVDFSAATAAKVLAGSNPSHGMLGNGGPSFEPRACDRIDLRTGKRVDHFDVPFPTQLIDFSPDGNLALFKIATTGDRLDVYALESAKHVVGFRPYLGSDRGQEQVEAAAFVDAKHVLTTTGLGHIICWSLPDCKAVYSCESKGRWIAFSPDRRAYLMRTENGAFLVESLTGRVLGRLAEMESVGRQYLASAAFHSDGRKLAATAMAGDGTAVGVWDLASGKLESEFWVPADPFDIYWTGSKHLLLRQADPQSADPRTLAPHKAASPLDRPPYLLVDVEKKRVVWKYQLGFSPKCDRAPDDRFWYVASRDIGAPAKLVPLALPEPAALATINAAAPLNPILVSGGKVSLSVKLDLASEREGSDEFRDRLDRHFRDTLARNQITVDKQAPIAMNVVLKEWIGDEAMRLLTQRRGTLVIHPLEVRCEVTIAEPGKPGWSQTRKVTAEERLIGSFLDENIELPSAFSSKSWRNAFVWCKNFHLPRVIYPSSAYQGLGESRLTSEGAVTVKK